MTFSECYDCGEPLSTFLVAYGIAIFVLFLAGLLRHIRLMRLAGNVLATLSSLFFLATVNMQRHTGILWPASSSLPHIETKHGTVVVSPVADLVALLAAALLAITLFFVGNQLGK